MRSTAEGISLTSSTFLSESRMANCSMIYLLLGMGTLFGGAIVFLGRLTYQFSRSAMRQTQFQKDEMQKSAYVAGPLGYGPEWGTHRGSLAARARNCSLAYARFATELSASTGVVRTLFCAAA
jgi:hypothetical protein